MVDSMVDFSEEGVYQMVERRENELRLRLEQAPFAGAGHGLGAVIDGQLAEDRQYVGLIGLGFGASGETNRAIAAF